LGCDYYLRWHGKWAISHSVLVRITRWKGLARLTQSSIHGSGMVEDSEEPCDKLAEPARVRYWRWLKAHPELWIGLVAGVVVSILAIWLLRAVVLWVLGLVGRWLLETLVYMTLVFQN
jgi:hypothetical protein